MKNETEKILELFREYALKRLDNHRSELALSDHKASHVPADLLKLSHKQHRQIFETELADKIHHLINAQNKFIKSELKEISDDLIERLN